jgi:hypothetical protein
MLGLVVAVAAFAAGPSFAMTIDVSFDAETPFQIVANGYRTTEAPGVAFSDTVGANLQFVADPLRTNGSLALAVFNDHDGGGLTCRRSVSFAREQIS